MIIKLIQPTFYSYCYYIFGEGKNRYLDTAGVHWYDMILQTNGSFI